MKYLIYFILLINLAVLSGCGSGFANPKVQKYPQFSKIHNNYSADSISSFSLNMNCATAEVSSLNEDFLDGYCAMLEKDIKSFIHAHNPTWQYASAADIDIHINLEMLHGGDFNGRFFFPGNSGSQARTLLFVTIADKEKILAERRIFEYTAFINPLFDKFSNEATMTQDAVSIAEKVSDFVSNPAAYGSRYTR